MASGRHVEMVTSGAAAISEWRARRRRKFDLTGAELRYARLAGADLHLADLRHADLTEADLEGANLAIDITLGVERHRLREGDCLAMQLDRPTMFHNPTRKPTRYAVMIASEPPSRR